MATEVFVTNFPGGIAVTNFPAGFSVNNFPAGFAINNFPANIAVNNFPTGFQVTNFPEVQQVEVTNLPSQGNAVEVTNFPAVQDVSVTNFPAPQTSIEVSNFPAVQPVSVQNFPAFPSNFSVNNFPSSFSINNFPATQPVSGAVSVSNFPPMQPVSVQNFPATQPVSAATLPLPTGASTEATLAAVLAKLATNFGRAVSYFSLAQGAAGNTVVAAGSPGNRHKVLGFLITAAANSTVQFFSAGNAVTGAMDILARGNLSDPVSVLEPSFQTAVGESLNLTSTGGAVKGFIAYLTEP